MRKQLLPLLLAVGSLAACAADGSLSPKTEQAIKVACRVEAVAQPIIVTVVAATVPSASGVVALNMDLIHPQIRAACAAIGGEPMAGATISTSK